MQRQIQESSHHQVQMKQLLKQRKTIQQTDSLKQQYIQIPVMQQSVTQQPGLSCSIPFIQFHSPSSFTITPQSLVFLSQLTNPIAVISIVGKYRTGKSLFLNRVLLQSRDSFKVCPTINSCTKGLWLSRRVIKGGCANGNQEEDIDVLVIDTEGFGAIEETDQYNNKILLFALLLSSYFIYNSVGSIDQKSLNSLNILTNLAKQLQSKSPSSTPIQHQFPSFLWLVRDFTLSLTTPQGEQMQPKQYLQSALEIQKGTSDSIQNKNKIRRMIKYFFKDRDCFTMVRPVENQADLQKLNEMEDSGFRPQFLEQIQVLRNRILRRVKGKRIKGKRVNGEGLAQMAKFYVDCINGNMLPNIQNAFKNVCNYEMNKTITISKQLILKRCQQFINPKSNQSHSVICPPKSQSQLLSFKQSLFSELHSLIKKSLSQPISPKVLTSHQQQLQLQTLLGQNYSQISNFLHQQFASICKKNKEKQIDQLKEFLDEKLEKGNLEYETDVDRLEEKFKEIEKEIYQEQRAENGCLKEFLLDCYWPLKSSILAKLIKVMATKEAKLQAKNKEITLTILRNQQKYRIAIQQANKQIEEKNSSLLKLEVKIQQNLKLKQIQVGFLRRQIQQLRDQTRRRDKRQEDTQSQWSQQRKQHQQLIQTLRQKLSQSSTQIATLSSTNSHLSSQLHSIKSNLSQKSLQLSSVSASYQSLQSHSSELANKLAIKQAELARKGEQLEKIMGKYEQLVRENQENLREIGKMDGKIKADGGKWEAQVRVLGEIVEILKGDLGRERDRYGELMEVNKNMGFALKHLQKRFQQVQQRQKKLKQYKKCVKNSSCMQCINCTKFFVPAIFPQHLSTCILSSDMQPKKSQSPSSLQIFVKQTLLKDSDSKPYTEYILELQKPNRTWTINRKYKQFCNLHSELKGLLPGVVLSDCSYIVNPQDAHGSAREGKKALLVEERRKILEKYLRDLAGNPHIVRQRVWKQFISDEDNETNFGFGQNGQINPQNLLLSYPSSQIQPESNYKQHQLSSRLPISDLLRSQAPNSEAYPQNEGYQKQKQNKHESNSITITSINGIKNTQNYNNNYNYSHNHNHKTPQQFLKIWNERNLRAKQVSKTKKYKN